MKALRVALNVTAALLLLSTAICGLWLRGQGASVDPSSLDFHMTIGLAAVAVGLLAAGSGLSRQRERRATIERPDVSSPSHTLVARAPASVKGR